MRKKPDNETNRPFKEAVWASLEGRFLRTILLSIMMQPSPPAARNPFGTVRRAASRGETRMPRAFAGSKISRRPPALARERLPASSGRPASPACAVGWDVLQSRVFLHASPPAPRRRREASVPRALGRSAKRPAGVSEYKGCERPARRTPGLTGRENVFLRKKPP